MARYCGDKESEATLEAVEYWKNVALLGEKSIFSNEKIWTLENLESLERDFIGQPDEGEGDFFQKLEQQLSNTEAGVKKLAAELLWLLFLCPSNITSRKKRKEIENVWKWSGDMLPENLKWLEDKYLEGVGSAGVSFNIMRWRELAYTIRLLLKFRALTNSDQKELLADGYKFATWLEQLPENDSRQFRHMILFLLFPDRFERIFGGTDRISIVSSFTGMSKREIRSLSALELDGKLEEIRREQEQKNTGQPLDFYLTPLKEVWKKNETTEQSSITKSNVIAAIKEIDERGVKSDERSITYDLIYHAKRYPPKLVYAIAHKYAGGEELDRNTFEGGENTECFKILRDLGFHIERKDFVKNLIEKFIAQAEQASDLSTRDYPRNYCGLNVNVSFGQGNFARIPWISFTGYGQTTQEGIYPGFLYYKSVGCLLLTYGISETRRPKLDWPEHVKEQTVSDILHREYSHDPERYGPSYVAASYRIPSELDTEQITPDLDKVIAEFEAVAGKHVAEYPEPKYGEEKKVATEMKFPLNLIYYGPPGTGKTYIAMEKAVEICDGSMPSSRAEIVQRFKELQDDKRISFVTFHQSYSYEDFVEGIRPVLAEDEIKDVNNTLEVQYECRPGIFKTICTLSKSTQVSSKSVYDFDQNKNKVWKMSLGNTLDPNEAEIYDDCIQHSAIVLGYGQRLDYTGCDTKQAVATKLREAKPDASDNDYNITSVNYFKNLMKVGDIVIVSDGNLKFRAIGKVTGEYIYKGAGDYEQARPVEWLLTYEESQPYEKIINKKFSQMTLYQIKPNVLKIDALKRLLSKPDISEPENHVLIIDEINRGNIAKIFGELITLIEPDKRLGAANELTATLPYSNTEFGVPQNLYIVGTMNTADRSIALLDTALRRRFKFEELMPQQELIPGTDNNGNIPDGEGGTIDLRSLLKAINQRICFLLNRDQMIGHAYFMKIKSFDELRRVMSQQIVPLLQEYFYEDWHRIQLVLHDLKIDGEKNEPQLIRHEKVNELDILGYDHEDYEDGIEYFVKSESEIKPDTIRKIYET